MNTVATQNIAWVRAPVNCGMSSGWAETIWSIEVIALGLVSEGFLIDQLEFLPLVFHGLLWEFPNMQATLWRSFLILLSFLGSIPLLDSTMRDMKEQWFSVCYQHKISLSSRTRTSLVDHSLAMSSLEAGEELLNLTKRPSQIPTKLE